MKILSSEVAAGVMVLLLIMETSVRSSEACRGTTPSPGNSVATLPEAAPPLAPLEARPSQADRDVGVPPRDHSGRVPGTVVAADRKVGASCRLRLRRELSSCK
ncbi:BHLH domain-containing protein [Psidium guajava]|nr:BHLH domain-containing protein [Psidium guajava]